ncbi:Rho guanine nucleotide exchange factor (GEF) 17 [Balamuthia mandrillaris]
MRRSELTEKDSPTGTGAQTLAGPADQLFPSFRLKVCRPERFQKLWDDSKTGAAPSSVTILRPIPPTGYYRLGDMAERGKNPEVLDPSRFPVSKVKERDEACFVVAEIETNPTLPLLVPPVDYRLLWTEKGSGASFGRCSFWEPVPPEGYKALGCVASQDSRYSRPDLDLIRCVHESVVVTGAPGFEHDGLCLWSDINSGASFGRCSIWRIHPLSPLANSIAPPVNAPTRLLSSTSSQPSLSKSSSSFTPSSSSSSSLASELSPSSSYALASQEQGFCVGTFTVNRNYIKPSHQVFCLQDSTTISEQDLAASIRQIEQRRLKTRKSTLLQSLLYEYTAEKDLHYAQRIQQVIQCQRHAKRWLMHSKLKKMVREYSASEHAKAYRHRSKIIAELISSEEKYVEFLEILTTRFYEPLKAAAENSKLGVVTPYHIDIIFCNIEDILVTNQSLFNALCLEVNKENPAIGATFAKKLSSLVVYNRYYENFESANKVLHWCQQTVPEFIKAVKKLEDSQESTKLHLDSLIVMPIQRLPRYELLLKDIIKHTPESHIDLQLMRNVLKEIQTLAAHLDQLANDQLNQHQNILSSALHIHHVEVGEVKSVLIVSGEELRRLDQSGSAYDSTHFYIIFPSSNKLSPGPGWIRLKNTGREPIELCSLKRKTTKRWVQFQLSPFAIEIFEYKGWWCIEIVAGNVTNLKVTGFATSGGYSLLRKDNPHTNRLLMC